VHAADVAVFIIHYLDHIIRNAGLRRPATTSDRSGRSHVAAAVATATAVSGCDVGTRSPRARLEAPLSEERHHGLLVNKRVGGLWRRSQPQRQPHASELPCELLSEPQHRGELNSRKNLLLRRCESSQVSKSALVPDIQHI
jgi:hypothetical protein